jgi:hypothetical protein
MVAARQTVLGIFSLLGGKNKEIASRTRRQDEQLKSGWDFSNLKHSRSGGPRRSIVWRIRMDKSRIFLGSSGKQEKLLQALTRGLEDVAHVEPQRAKLRASEPEAERGASPDRGGV